MKLSRVLIANRGEIAVRIIKACRALDIDTVLAASEADRETLGARLAGRTVCIGPASAAGSYLNHRAIIAAALGTGCDAVHPGYGFLAESPVLAEACHAHGLVFIGPQARQIRQMGNKLEARALAIRNGVPILPGSEHVSSAEQAAAQADEVGFPVMLKAAAGGGGRGMKIVRGPEEMRTLFDAASAEARAAFKDDTLYLERYIPNARHIEVQVLGDRFGKVIHLGERDCSMQRRHQKLIEESPAPDISEDLREEIRAAGASLAQSIAYENAGTVEFILDQDEGRFYFLEMNTRIQVEHPVTEAITGVDLVQEQLRIAGGEPLRLDQTDVQFTGHALECRINAEVPEAGFRPSPGRIDHWVPPEGPRIRVDSHCFPGYTVPIFYDSMIAKLIVHGNDRSQSIALMQQALERFVISGIGTTIPFLRTVLEHEEFCTGRVNTRLTEDLVREFSSANSAA